MPHRLTLAPHLSQNGGTLPRHMNLLTFDLAMADLQTLKHHAARLADDDCLPLGVAPTSS